MMGNFIGNRVGIFIPTLNAANQIDRIVETIKKSSIPLSNVFFIDSESTDNTVSLLQQYQVKYQIILQKNFSHGFVRHEAVLHFQNKVDYLLMMTQDVIFTEESIDQLISGIDKNPEAGVSYGRQRNSHKNSVEYYDRYFNYPRQSQLKSRKDIKKLGPSTYFSSDAFSIYRMTAVVDVGNFPADVEFAEDAYMAAKMILQGWSVYYNADAVVVHNNVSGYRDLYKRYRHISKFYHNQKWISDSFGTNYDKGRKLVIFELKESWRNRSIRLFFDIIISSLIKFAAYR